MRESFTAAVMDETVNYMTLDNISLQFIVVSWSHCRLMRVDWCDQIN